MRGSRPKSELELTEFSSRGKSESNILQCHQSVTPPVHHFKHPAVPSECYSTSSSLRVTFNLKHLLNNMMLLYFFADKTRSRKSDISILSQRSPPPSSLYLTLTLCKLSTIISKCQLHNYPSWESVSLKSCELKSNLNSSFPTPFSSAISSINQRRQKIRT